MSNHRKAISLSCALLIVSLAHAGTIQFQVTDIGQGQLGSTTPPLQRYIYFGNGITFQAYQELDILFDASLYGTLSNPVSIPGFDVVLFQPNNPIGAPGDFSALALSDVGSALGLWSVDFTFKGTGLPGSQTYFINQYDANGNFVATLETGTTLSPAASQDAPEPGSFVLVGLVVAGRSAWKAVRRRSARSAIRA